MRAVGLAWAPPLAGDQAGVRKRAREGMSDWERGGPVGMGGSPYRRGVAVEEEVEEEDGVAVEVEVVVLEEEAVVVVDGVGPRSRSEETLVFRGGAAAAGVAADVEAVGVERAGGE
jgi:hypothetical protein